MKNIYRGIEGHVINKEWCLFEYVDRFFRKYKSLTLIIPMLWCKVPSLQV